MKVLLAHLLLLIVTCGILGFGCKREAKLEAIDKLIKGHEYKQAITILEKVLKTNPDLVDYQVLLLKCYVLHGGPEVEQDIWDQMDTVRKFGRRAIKGLSELMRDDEDEVKGAAGLVLSRMGRAGFDVIKRLLKDPDWRIRRGAVVALGNVFDFGIMGTDEEFKTSLDTEKNEEIRKMASESIEIGVKEAKDEFKTLLTTEKNKEVLKTVRESLKAIEEMKKVSEEKTQNE